jgi:hypothetical protein
MSPRRAWANGCCSGRVADGVVGLELLLAYTDRLAVYLPELIVYPDVVVLRLQLLGRQPPQPGIETGPGRWRFGVQFSDGAKATSKGSGSMLFARLRPTPEAAASRQRRCCNLRLTG